MSLDGMHGRTGWEKSFVIKTDLRYCRAATAATGSGIRMVYGHLFFIFGSLSVSQLIIIFFLSTNNQSVVCRFDINFADLPRKVQGPRKFSRR